MFGIFLSPQTMLSRFNMAGMAHTSALCLLRQCFLFAVCFSKISNNNRSKLHLVPNYCTFFCSRPVLKFMRFDSFFFGNENKKGGQLT